MIERMIDEPQIEYAMRLIEAKKEGIKDLDWIEIVQLLGENLNKDTLRKSQETEYGGYKVHKYYQEKYKNGIDSNELLLKLEKKKLEIQAEKNKLSSLRLDLNKSVRNQSRIELWVEELIKASNITIQVPEFKPVNVPQNKEYLLTIADIHTGKKCQSLENYIDFNVIERRFWQLRDEMVELIKERQISTLKILNLGDTIDGLLRASQIQHLEMQRPQQVVKAVRLIAEWLNSLSEYAYIDYKTVTSSNHSEGRPIGSQRGEFQNDDYEIIIYEWLKDILKSNNRIQFQGNSIVEFDICGRKIGALHGHQLRGLDKKNLLRDVAFHLNKDFQYLMIGHLHHTEIKTVGRNHLGNKEVIYCPSISGDDQYSDSIWTGSKAGALLFEFTEKQGRRSVTDIILD